MLKVPATVTLAYVGNLVVV